MLALVLSIVFDLAYISAADARQDRSNGIAASRLAESLVPVLETGDTRVAERLMANMANGQAYVTDTSGKIIAGADFRDSIGKTRQVPILAPGGRELGTLHAGNIVENAFLIPLPIMLSTTIIVVIFAYWVSSFFARTTSLQIQTLSDALSKASKGQLRSEARTLLFREFRYLKVELFRTFRRLRNENTRLLQAAYTDERTGLGNSAKLTRDLTSFIAGCSFEEPAAYILLEAESPHTLVENHSTLLPNDIHAALAKRLSQIVAALEDQYSMPRGSWPIFALQSDGFAILVDRIGGRADVMRFVRQVLDALRQTGDFGRQTPRLRSRAGIVMIPEDGQAPLDIRKRAESALVQAGRADAVNFHFYSPKLERQTAARKRLEAEVLQAVEERRFVPVFQPKIDLRTGRIIGAEALARWMLESGRVVSPNVFIPVAEATGLIGRIGMQITDQACRAAAQWHGRGYKDVTVAVNVSPLQFDTDDLGAMIIRALSSAGLPPRLLQLEITESVAVSNPEQLNHVIGPLKTMGVKLAIDDFGTGHSNLAMLGRLPFDVFKIDRAFISSLYTDKQAPAIVEMILGMAETLGMETVAEGVETEAQEKFLRQRGCDQYQGFYYSPPVSLEKFMAMLEADRQGPAVSAG